MENMSITVEQFKALTDGNMGALNAVTHLAQRQKNRALAKLVSVGLSGVPIYMLWSDVCGRDVDALAHVINTAPEHTLREAMKPIESVEDEDNFVNTFKHYLPK